jgi:protein N-terminal methyltransferase
MSRYFIASILQWQVNSTIKDCGAGIGRITKNLLVNLFENVDILEQCPSFVEKAKTELSSSPKVKNFYCSGMQEFSFERKYDLIWIQWVIGHLTDSDFVSFFAKCKEALTPNGMVVLKDNNCSKGFIVDKVDSSVTRY